MFDIFAPQVFVVERLEDIAAAEVINIFYSIQRIVRKYQYLLYYCHYKFKCNACIISGYPCNFYKSFARRNLKGLVKDFYWMIELKSKLIEQAGYKVIFFEEESKLAFFANKLPILTHSYCKPNEIIF